LDKPELDGHYLPHEVGLFQEMTKSQRREYMTYGGERTPSDYLSMGAKVTRFITLDTAPQRVEQTINVNQFSIAPGRSFLTDSSMRTKPRSRAAPAKLVSKLAEKMRLAAVSSSSESSDLSSSEDERRKKEDRKRKKRLLKEKEERQIAKERARLERELEKSQRKALEKKKKHKKRRDTSSSSSESECSEVEAPMVKRGLLRVKREKQEQSVCLDRLEPIAHKGPKALSMLGIFEDAELPPPCFDCD